jgi:hypothetical protein
MKIKELRAMHEAKYIALTEEKASVDSMREANKAVGAIMKSYSAQLKYAEMRGDKPELPDLES